MQNNAYVTIHPAGTTAREVRAGDFLLTGATGQGLVSKAIKLGSWLRGYDKPFRRFSHTVLIVNPNGMAVEAASSGVQQTHISNFKDEDYVIVHTNVDEHDQPQIIQFVWAVLEAKTKYGFVTFAGLALYCLTGGQLCIQKAGTAICSGLVCDALTRAGYIWDRPPYAMMPADLAKHFGVTWDPGDSLS
jgi:hypothetical protein